VPVASIFCPEDGSSMFWKIFLTTYEIIRCHIPGDQHHISKPWLWSARSSRLWHAHMRARAHTHTHVWTELNSVTLVCKRTILTERLPLVDKLSANFCKQRVSRGQHYGSSRPYSQISRLEPLLLLASSSSIVLRRLSGPCTGPIISQLVVPGIKLRTSGSVARTSDH
jgi:hypothetical protein